ELRFAAAGGIRLSARGGGRAGRQAVFTGPPPARPGPCRWAGVPSRQAATPEETPMARSTWQRWLPAGAVVALVAGTVTVTSQAGAVDLPDKSPQDVLTLLLEQDVRAYSGAFETSAALGLPVPSDIDLGPGGPELDDAAGAVPPEGGEDAQEVLSALELLTGDNSGRVFVGVQCARFQLTDTLA